MATWPGEARTNKLLGKNGEIYSKSKSSEGIFNPIWPSDTRGNGRIAANNRISGGAQSGAKSTRLKVHCRQCGFLADLNRDDSSGGSLDGDGAIGSVTLTTPTITVAGVGFTYTENVRSRSFKRGAGCPLCGSKNYSLDKPGRKQQSIPSARVGF